MAMVTEASLKQDALELLSRVIRGGLCEQDRIDTALEVLLALRNDPVDDAFGLTEEEVEWASSVPWIEGEPWVVSVARLVKERDAEQGDTAPTEGMTQQDTVELLTALAVRLHRFADECSRRAADGSPNESAHDTGRSDAYRDSWGRVLHVLRRIADAGKLVSTTDGIDFDEVTDAATLTNVLRLCSETGEALRELADDSYHAPAADSESNADLNEASHAYGKAWDLVSRLRADIAYLVKPTPPLVFERVPKICAKTVGDGQASDADNIDFDEETDAVTRPSDAERDAEQDDD